MTYLYFDDTLQLADSFAISPRNRSFLYGDGLFETIRCLHGVPLWIELHYERLSKSAQLLGIELPDDLSHKQLSWRVSELLLKNGHTQGARVRVTLFRQEGGLYFPENNKGSILIQSSPTDDVNYLLPAKGLSVGIYRENYKPIQPLSAMKTNSALIYVLASGFARASGFDDALLINEHGNIAEATSSNIFLVSGGKLVTPAHDQGGVQGIMRQVIIQMAMEEKIKVDECDVSLNDLLQADELILTNAVRGLQWVLALGSKRYYHKLAGTLAAKLSEKAVAYVAERSA